jgi:adenylate cyclase
MMKQLVARLLAVGAYEGETATRASKRRIIVAAVTLATLLTVPTVADDFSAGLFWVAITNVVLLAAGVAFLVGLKLKPRIFTVAVNVLFALVLTLSLVETTLLGGLLPSGLAVVFGLIVAQAALVVFGLRAALVWFALFSASVVFAVVAPNVVEPLYVVDDASVDAGANLIATGIVTIAVLLYFVRQRDHFQRQSDELLHNILPDSVAERLKSSPEMIADEYEEVSVLFADVVDFTPMSSAMPPERLVGLLNQVFSTFDRLVDEMGLEKIKTVGDEYMVASGVPLPRPDHAVAISEFALRVQEHLDNSKFDGHRIQMRIGINSGPVVAGIIGTHKFAYDLWGDVVNTASRMESEGVAGSIQISEATHELVKDTFVCESRGVIPVKGKGNIETYLLLGRFQPPNDLIPNEEDGRVRGEGQAGRPPAASSPTPAV